MGYQTGFHAPNGGGDFLGFRKARRGNGTEIVYDDGVSRRMIWRVVADKVNEAHLSDGLAEAVASLRVLPTFFDEMRKRAIHLERVTS